MIKIWKFNDAPLQLRELYPQGTGETWVLEVPSTMMGEVQDVIRAAPFRASEVLRNELPDRTIIFFAPYETQSNPRGHAS